MDIIEKDSLYYLFLEIQKLYYFRMRNLLDEIGIYKGQPHMLYILGKRDGQSQRELAEGLNVKASTITVMINRMEKADLVERRQDPYDQRISRVHLTDKGRETCKKSNKIIKQIQNECFGNLTPEEQVILKRLFTQIRDNLIAL